MLTELLISELMLNEPVLVTGATGFIGQALIARLKKIGAHCIALASSLHPHDAKSALRPCKIEDSNEVLEIFTQTRPKTVIHLASKVTGARGPEAIFSTLSTNVVGTVNVLTAALATGVDRVVLAGSVEELPLDQAARYPYAASKRAATEYAQFFHSAYGLSTIVTRMGMAYGPGQMTTRRLIPYLTLSQLAGEKARLSSGKRLIDWIYIEDIVDALLAAATAPKSAGGSVVELGTGKAFSITEVAERLTAITGGPPPEFGALPERENDIDLIADPTHAEHILGFRARTSLDEGLRATVAWYQQERLAGRMEGWESGSVSSQPMAFTATQ